VNAVRRRRTKIDFFGHFGVSNLGNESTLVAILSRLRLAYPDHEFCCICTHPEVVVTRYGIDAVPISTRSVRIWDRRVRLDRRLRMAFVGVSEELRQYVRAFRTLEGTEMLIVPGTGLLTDAYGLVDWGPYSLFKWSLMAKLRGCRLLFVSVGAGPIRSTFGRLLVKSALSMADYRSYRDTPSMKCVEDIGVRTQHDRIYPDLVFGLPQTWMPTDEAPVRRRRVVGIGLMEYAGKYSVPDPTDDTYFRYLSSLTVFVQWVLNHDCDVKLLLGDGDTRVIQDFRTLLRARLGSLDENRVSYRPIPSFKELLSELGETDVVVATRFHNILMSLLLNKPVVAISFHHKCASLMSEMGLSEYCHDINHMDPDALIRQFESLIRNAEAVKRTIRERVEESRRAVNEQYDHLVAGLSDYSHSPVRSSAAVT
jgi:polysaccharide pyruvyl transferase WcaK-like protein